MKIVKYLKADRGPQGCYAPGDVAGFDDRVADKLIAQGYAELCDAGKGPGRVNPDLIRHMREPWEDSTALAAVKGRA